MTTHLSFQGIGSRWAALHPEPKRIIQFISFNQDFTAGNLAERTGDVHWIYQQLANTPSDGSLLHRELPGNHYQPVGYARGDRDLVN